VSIKTRILKGWYDPDDNSFSDFHSASRPNEREVYRAILDTGPFSEPTRIGPFESEEEARRAARDAARDLNKHRLFR
jgi:hypothetical protein